MKLTSFYLLPAFLAGGIAVSALCCTVAKADNVAQFAEQSTDASGLFSYTNTGAGATVAADELPVVLTFDSQTPNSAPSPTIDGLLDLSGSASSSATEIAPGVYDQSFKTLDISIYSASSPSTLLFTADGTGSNLSLNPGLFASGPTTSLISSTDAPTSAVTLTSPYVDPSLISADQGIALSLTNVNPNISQAADGSLNNFTADITGTFSASPGSTLVPEPSPAVAVLMAAAAVTGLVVVRRRNASKQV